MASSAGSDQGQLKENLAQYEAQLHQVEAALTNDPESDELVKLKSDLNDVIKLTRDLLELAPQPRKRSKPASGTEWKASDPCKAIWSDNGRYFDAVIDMVSDDQQTCTVTFDGYGTTEIVRVADLQVRDWDDPTAARVRSKTTKKQREEVKEYKKKKAVKKRERLQEISEHRESEKQKWKNFQTKGTKHKGGPLSSKQRRSIFAVPDSIEGRVGIGTCNIGGKGMTGYVQPKGYAH